MRVLIDDTIYNVYKVIYPEQKENILYIYVYNTFDASGYIPVEVECYSEYYADGVFTRLLTQGYFNLNKENVVKKLTFL